MTFSVALIICIALVVVGAVCILVPKWAMQVVKEAYAEARHSPVPQAGRMNVKPEPPVKPKPKPWAPEPPPAEFEEVSIVEAQHASSSLMGS